MENENKLDSNIQTKIKICFFVKSGLDNFLGDIIDALSNEYSVKKIIVTDLKQIDEGMEFANICWFEWCDELICYASKLSAFKDKKIICRLHSYEAFTNYPANVNFENVDALIFISQTIRKFVVNTFNINEENTVVIPNGINLEKWKFSKRKAGYNIAYVGYINYKKGPMLLLQTFKAFYDKDNNYKLFIAGQFQDGRDIMYFNQMIKELGLKNNVRYDGWQNDLDAWLEDKNYILCTSILESQNISIMQAMTKGIKPIIHNFVGAKNIYPEFLIWNTINEALDILNSNEYNSSEYYSFVKNNFELTDKLKEVNSLLLNI